MTYSIQKILIISIGLGIMSGCSKETPSTEIKVDSWKVEQPAILHQSNQEKLKEREIKLSSHFEFKSLYNQKKFQIDIQSICRDENKDRFSKSSTYKNQTRFKVKNLLSKNIYRKPILKNHSAICDFIFIVSNELGSTQEIIAENIQVKDIHLYEDFELVDERNNSILGSSDDHLDPSHILRMRVSKLSNTSGTITLLCGQVQIEEYFNNLNSANIARLFDRLREKHPVKLRSCKLLAKTNQESLFVSKPFKLHDKLKEFEELDSSLVFKISPDHQGGTLNYLLRSKSEKSNVIKKIRNINQIISEVGIAGFVQDSREIQIQEASDPIITKITADGKPIELKDSPILFKNEISIQWRVTFDCSLNRKIVNGISPKYLGLYLLTKNLNVEQSLVAASKFNANTDLMQSYSIEEHLTNNILTLRQLGPKEANYNLRKVHEIVSIGPDFTYYPLCN